jgi:hypothetical protein
MFIDTLNEQYDTFYNDMWPSYENWRQLNLTENKARREIKRKAIKQQLIGALLIAGAIAAGSSSSGSMAAVQTSMIVIGSQVLINGFNVSKEAEIHEAAIQELSESLLRTIYFTETGFNPNTGGESVDSDDFDTSE